MEYAARKTLFLEKKGLIGQRCLLFTIWIGGGFQWVLEGAGGREQGEELPSVCICCSSSCTDSKAALIVRWIVGQELQLCFGMLVFSPALLTSGRQEKWGGCRAARNNNRNIGQLIHHTLQHHLPFTFPVLKSHCTIQISNCSWIQQKMRGCGGKKRDPSITGQCFYFPVQLVRCDLISKSGLYFPNIPFKHTFAQPLPRQSPPHSLGYLGSSTSSGCAPSQKICGGKLRMETLPSYYLTLSSVFARIHKHGQREMCF